MRPRRLFVLGSAAVLLVGGFTCLTAFRPKRKPVVIFAAVSLTDAFYQLADTLKFLQPGLKVDINFAGSQALALQLQQGAAADVFASADERWMNAVQDGALTIGPATVFARNRLVVIVPKSNPAHITRLQDLSRSGIKLVLAADAVPAGRYARTAFTKLATMSGYGTDFATKVARNVVSNEDNVKGVVAKVQLGEADAGVVYVSDVTTSVAKLVTTFQFPDSAAVVANYPIALLNAGTHTDAGRAFIDLVMSPTGQAVLAKNGFIPVSAKP